MEYTIRIKLESDLCVGNGEARGNAIDRDICSDSYGLPYIPARRLKGCLRQTAEFLQKNGFGLAHNDNVMKLFGNPFGEEGNLVLDDAHIKNAKAIRQTISEMDKSYLKRYTHPENVEKLFTTIRGQTRLEDGVKIDSTLRFTRVLTKNNDVFNAEEPIEFISSVYLWDESEEQLQLLKACCKGTRHIGTGRNRGLGNASISLEVSDKKEGINIPEFIPDENTMYQMSYKVVLDSPVTIPGCGELMTSIPARSVIGCLAGCYMKNKMGEDNLFQDLFLNGNVKWSALTPVIEEDISSPVPVMLVKLKNGGGKLINQFADNGDEWKKLKPKTIEGSYSCYIYDDCVIKGFRIADVETHAQYHNSVSNATLYTQDAIKEGYVYGGKVSFSGKNYDSIINLLSESKLRFGRSKNIQYANCFLSSVSTPVKLETKFKEVKSEKIYVVLQSDTVLNKDGVYITDDSNVRKMIMEGLAGVGLQTQNCSEEYEIKDIVRYGIIGGFQNQWHLQKTQIPIIKAGSVYIFEGQFKNIPEQITIGEIQQEGFGVCRVFTDEEICGMDKVERKSVERYSAEKLNEKDTEKIEIALAKQCVRECLLKYAYSFQGDYKDIPFGRLRLMLEKSKDYNDLIQRINTMKESDVSSESNGKKDATTEFLKKFYGDKKIDWKKLLNSETGLFEVVSKDEERMKDIESKMWKLPLIQLLHILHYEKENN